MQDILVVDGLNKTIRSKKILSNVSFNVPNKKICAFIGHNGAGKTTTIKSILNLYKYNSGKISINGINSKNIKSHNEIGYVPEKENFPKMSAYTFLKSMGELHNMKKEDIKNKIQYWSKVFSLKNRLDQKLTSMSSGQKKKIMIMQCLLHDPNLLIMDEPTENLDPDTRDIFYKIIKKIKSSGRSVFISTHNLDEVKNYANYIVIIVNGKIKFFGDLKEGQDLHNLYNKYKPKTIL